MCNLSYHTTYGGGGGEGTSLLGRNSSSEDDDSPQKNESNYSGEEPTKVGRQRWNRFKDIAIGFALCALLFVMTQRQQPFTTTTTANKNNDYPLPSNKKQTSGGGGDPVVDLKAPPMGFMSWERFRCQIDCNTFPNSCINENLYMNIADALVEDGYAKAGYRSVNIDDCWTDKVNGRDSSNNNKLRPDPNRFPHGIAWLSNYMHSKGLELGIYTDAGIQTCAHYSGSQGYEIIDAQTFAEWGVDYIKLDGCNIHNATYNQVYTTFGNALKTAAPTKPMALSCSWPAYMGDNEGNKPFEKMYHQAGCNTWRNYKDVDNTWHSLHKIILHWADYWKDLQNIPVGSYNDADMLLVGDDHYGTILPVEQAKLQMGFWSMIASPLFIGGDVRTIPKDYRDILINPHIIAINQDPSRKQADCVLGCRGTTTTTTTTVLQHENNNNNNSPPPTILTTSKPIQVWSKSLHYGKSRALAFLNIGDETTVTTTATNIAYNYTVEGVIAQCVDLWSDDPTKDVCGKGQGATTDEWKIQLLNNHEEVILQIQARNVGPTSHRLLRIDYMCDDNNEDEGDCKMLERNKKVDTSKVVVPSVR